MSFGFLGIQFGFALQNANVSRIFETLGADVSQIPILWIAAPVTGLVVQPIVGYLSDNTWNRFGRRRPYFFVGAVLASLALFVMPNSPYLWMAAGMLWIMDASINISMEPFRAFVGDMLPSEQRTKGFAMQSFFIGTAAFIGSFLPYMMTNWFGIANTAPEGVIPDSVKYSFYFGGGIFFLAVMWTILKTKEYSPEELEAFDAAEKEEYGIDGKIAVPEIPLERRIATKLRQGPVLLLIGALMSAAVYLQAWEQELYILTVGTALVGAVLIIAGLLQKRRIQSGLVVVFDDLYTMPKTMKQLAWVQFFSWFALFAMWIYTTSAVTSHIYDMDMEASEVRELSEAGAALEAETEAAWYERLAPVQEDLRDYQAQIIAGQSNVTASMRVVNFFQDESRVSLSEGTRNTLRRIEQQYNEGADWVGVAFGIYNGFAAIVAFMLPWLARLSNRKITHAVSLAAGALGLISIYFISAPWVILVSMV
ncbi:MAG: MFS transporter, partial [Cyclonatronaceae bacterium]